MSDKLSALTVVTTVAGGDYVYVALDPTGSPLSRAIAVSDLMQSIPNGTAADPGLTFVGSPTTGLFRAGADQIGIAIAGVDRGLIALDTFSFCPDRDATTTLGRARIGSVSADEAWFAHFDRLNATGYALRATSAGALFLNALSGQNLTLAISNSYRGVVANDFIAFGAGLTDIGGTLNVQALNVADHTILARGIANQTGAFFRAETSAGARVWDVVPLIGATPTANETSMTLSSTWAPTSTAFTFTQFAITPTINQTGTASGGYDALLVSVTQTAYLGAGNAANLLRLRRDGSDRFYVRSDGSTLAVGAIRSAADSAGFYTGASDDLRVYHDGTDSWILNATGIMRMQAPAGSTANLAVQGTGDILVASASGITNPKDSQGFYTGIGNDLRVYHDGTNSIIANITGQTILTNPGLHRINQSGSTAGTAVLELDQDDTDQPFIDFDGTIAADLTSSVTSMTVPGAIKGFTRVKVEGWTPAGTAFWIPIYEDPTA